MRQNAAKTLKAGAGCVAEISWTKYHPVRRQRIRPNPVKKCGVRQQIPTA